MSYAPCDPGAMYLYSLPHGSFGSLPFFQYGPFQLDDARRRGEQRLQAFLRRRIAADLELVEIERLADLVDLDLRGVGLGLFALAEEVAADDAHHDADQHQHDQDLDERHAACGAARCACEFFIIAFLCLSCLEPDAAGRETRGAAEVSVGRSFSPRVRSSP